MDKFRLEYEMKRKGISVENLCEKIGISRSAYYRKCNGKSEFTRGEIEEIMKVLGISLEDGIHIFFTSEVS